jgi:hypothetical protein
MFSDALLTTAGNEGNNTLKIRGNKLQFHKNYDGVRATSLLGPDWKQTEIYVIFASVNSTAALSARILSALIL